MSAFAGGIVMTHAAIREIRTREALNLCLSLRRLVFQIFVDLLQSFSGRLAVRTSDCRSKRPLASGALQYLNVFDFLTFITFSL